MISVRNLSYPFWLYHSGALIPEDGFSSGEAFENPSAPSGFPGSRASHVVVKYHVERQTTIDICNGQWVLFCGPGGRKWIDADNQLKFASSISLQSYQFGPEGKLKDIHNHWSSAYGVTEEGVVLIRPDGFIDWRALGANDQPELVLSDVFKHLHYHI